MKAGTCLQQQFRKQTRKAFLYLENCHLKRKQFFSTVAHKVSEEKHHPAPPTVDPYLRLCLRFNFTANDTYIRVLRRRIKVSFLKTQRMKMCVGNVVFPGLGDPPHGPS